MNQLNRLLALWVLDQLAPEGYIDPTTDEAVLGPTLRRREMQLAAVALLLAEQTADATFLKGTNLAVIQEDIT